jgi:hypothetical protein
MNVKSLSLAVMVTGFMGAVGYSAGMSSLSGGRYMATLSPSVDEQTADRIEKRLGKIREISMNDVKPEDSSLHFTVKDDRTVDVSRIKDAIKAAAPNVTIGEPVLNSDANAMGAANTTPSATTVNPTATSETRPNIPDNSLHKDKKNTSQTTGGERTGTAY